MAKLTANSPLQGMQGVLGGLVFRSLDGKTIVSARPEISHPRDQTERQRRTRLRFAEATRYAHKMRHDPAMKEYYWKKAKELKLPNAYTAAIAEYLRKTKIESMSTEHDAGEAGQSIAVVAPKKDFTVGEVNVRINTKGGQEIEKAPVTKTASLTVVGVARKHAAAHQQLQDRLLPLRVSMWRGSPTYHSFDFYKEYDFMIRLEGG